MTPDHKKGTKPKISLRHRAEEILCDRAAVAPPAKTDDTAGTIQELQVHQIELELQNEKLWETEQQIQKSLDLYASLYDFAPVGYFTLDGDNRILVINLTACKMLGCDRKQLLKTRFTRFVDAEGARALYFCLKKASEKTGASVCDLEIKRLDGTGFSTELRIESVSAEDGTPNNFQIVMIDISARKILELELRSSNQRLGGILENLQDAYFQIDTAGIFKYANQTAFRMYGFDSIQEMIGLPVTALYADLTEREKLLAELTKCGHAKDFVAQGRRRDGSTFWVSMNAQLMRDEKGQISGTEGVVRDITERKMAEEEALITSHLEDFAASGGIRQAASGITAYLQDWLGVEAVGMRLREGDDFPYFETCGFPAKFVRHENRLCAYGRDGKIMRDGRGDPVLECMCGNILCGRFDASKPFFTNNGSFWSNNTSALLASTTDEDRQSHTRNFCNGQGYESVALIPLRNGDDTFGLLQFNDHRTNRFTPALIARIEKIAKSLAMVMSKRQTEKELQASEEKFRTVARISPVGLYMSTPEGECTYTNDAWCRMAGLTPEEAMGKGWIRGIHPDDRQMVFDAWDHMVASEGKWGREYRFQNKEGKTTLVYGLATPQRDQSGKIVAYVGVNTDITERKGAEKAILANESKYRSLFDHTIDGVALHEVVQDSTGNVVDYITLDVNPAFEALLGVSRTAVVGKKASELLSSEELNEWLGIFGSVALTGNSTPYEMYSRLNKRYFRGSAFCPEPGKFAVTFTDVTDSKIAEKALRESEMCLNKAQRAAQIGSWIWHVQENTLEWSDEMYRIFGIGREGFSGYLSEVVANAIHPDDRAAVNASNLSVMKKNKPIPLEYRIVRPDGSIRTLWAEAGEMTIDSNGQALMLTGYVQDITERKIAEKALSDNEAKYRSIVETAAEGIILTTPDGVITYANQQMADLVGCSIVDLIGKVGVSFMKDAKPTTSLRSTLNKGGTLSQEFEITHQDGQKRRVWSIATPIINESQEHAAYLHMFTDITEQKMAEEKIKASLEEKEVLLKEIQHRVKNNMQVMVSLLQMQAARVKDPADAQLFKDSQERVRSMALVYEKLHQSEDLARVNLKKYVTDLVDNLVRSYSVGSGTHRTIIEVSEIKLGLDTAIPCGLIINEVISNSLKYAFPDGRTGTISVVINETDGRLEMAIADDGIGLPEEISRGWMSSLGMQLIHSLTEYQLGGKVEIERSGGTKYRIVFPLK